MADPSSNEHSTISASTSPDDERDICFVNKKGRVSLGNSLAYGKETPASSTRPSLSSRSASAIPTGGDVNSATLTEAGLSKVASTHRIQHYASTTPPAHESSQNQQGAGSLPRSKNISEESLMPNQILLKEESRVAIKPKDSYFTLIWLDRFYEVKAAPKSKGVDKAKAAPKSEGKGQPEPQTRRKDITLPEFSEMDDSYAKVLDSLGLCGHCKTQTKEILWRNIREYESRYESRCRTCGDDAGVCFLKFHTMQAPYLNESNFILALVHHVKIPLLKDGGYGELEEHIFAFVLGLSASDIGKLFTSLRNYWENPLLESGDVGLTTRLFLAAVLKLYGFREAQDSILDSFGKLETIGEKLIELTEMLQDEVDSNKEKAVPSTIGAKKKILAKEEENQLKDKFIQQMQNCTDLNLSLTKMDKALPGVRSRVHYVGLCAQGLLRDQSRIQEYIRDHFTALECEKTKTAASGTRPEQVKSVDQVIKALSSSRYNRRDDDKLNMLNRSMQQFEIDIKSLKARANIAIGLVATEYARSQGNFQSLVIQATERDGSMMRSIAKITVFSLPATFLALFFTTPMIQWAKPVVQLASTAPDSLVDTGSPILVVIPFFLWLGLSILVSLGLWARLKAKAEQKSTLTWFVEKVIAMLSVFIKRFRSGNSRKTKQGPALASDGLYTNPSHHSTTVRLEDGEEVRTQTFAPPFPQNEAVRENVESQTAVMSGARTSDESTLGSGSITEGTQGIQMKSVTPVQH